MVEKLATLIYFFWSFLYQSAIKMRKCKSGSLIEMGINRKCKSNTFIIFSILTPILFVLPLHVFAADLGSKTKTGKMCKDVFYREALVRSSLSGENRINYRDILLKLPAWVSKYFVRDLNGKREENPPEGFKPPSSSIKTRKMDKKANGEGPETKAIKTEWTTTRASLGIEKNKENAGSKESEVSEESKLKAQGFRAIHYEGLDHVREQIAFGKRLRAYHEEGTFDPEKTHVPEYASQIIETIEYMRRGMDKQWPKNYEKVLAVYSKTKKEVMEEELLRFGVKAFDEIEPDHLPKEQMVSYFSLRNLYQQIQYIEEILNNFPKFEEKRLDILEEFIEEAQNKLNKEEVTYNWWIKWNLRLAKWASPIDFNYKDMWWREDLALKDLIAEYPKQTSEIKQMFLVTDSFPVLISFPIRRDLGIMALNEASQFGVIPIGIMNRVIEYVDGVRDYSPSAYARHDFNHARNAYGGVGEYLYNYIKQNTRQWNTEDREKMEMIYFYVTHEISQIHLASEHDIYKLQEIHLKKDLIKRLNDDKDLGSLLPENTPSVEEYVTEAVDLFFQLALSAFK